MGVMSGSGSGSGFGSGSGSGSGALPTMAPTKKSCPLGKWGALCDKYCDCQNEQPCLQNNGTCLCNECYTGPTCGDDTGKGECVLRFIKQANKKDLGPFNGYIPKASASALRDLLASNTGVEESDLTAVSNEIIMQDSGDHVLRINAKYKEGSDFASYLTTKCKEGEFRATCICNTDERDCTMNI
ncbi:uncharacterized protein [Oscarella lobularis]